MSKKTILIILIPVLAVIIAAIVGFLVLGTGSSKGYSGTVTADGKPIANVSVSDGRNVVKTDENGKFFLKGYRKTRFITVTAPAGYWTEKYYISADKEKAEGYDFDLQKSDIAAGAAHSFLQISDTEIGENGVGEWINYLKDIAEKDKPAFLIHTGDICYEAGLKKHIEDMNTENMGLPVRYIIGNHDYVDGSYGEELFESLYGPVWYSFEVGNVHYVVTPFQTGADRKSAYNKNDRWRWLENDLANTDPNMKVVMFNHNIPPNDEYVISFDRKELDLKQHNLIAWVFGHYHYNYIEENESGIYKISTARPDCGGIDSSVSGARMIQVDENGAVTTNMYYYDFDGNVPEVENAKWVTQLEDNILFTDTVVKDNVIYTATVDEDVPVSCGIYAIDAQNGKILWEYKTANSIKNNIVVEENRLFAQDAEGNAYCIDAENGKEIWQAKSNLGTSIATSSGIAVDDGVLYAGCAAGITAYDVENGSVIWENIRNHGEASPAEFVVAGDKLLVSSHWDALAALDKKTGKKLWENRDGDLRFRSSTPAVIDENTLIAADSNAIMIIDANSGEITHKDTHEDINFSSSAQPVIDENFAYIPTANKGIIAYDLNSKSIVWQFEPGRAMIYTAPYTSGDSQTVEPTPVLKDGSLIFGASDGVLYKISAKTGKLENSAVIGAPIFGKCAIIGDDAAVTDYSGRVIRINDFCK
ncbi:MAG: PQQ-binding-like beta-propeller repeat protein [Eubacterium sp.]|nr:PQQ-binding-like beta-propeller repeat protein [Eubacterium sp.]